MNIGFQRRNYYYQYRWGCLRKRTLPVFKKESCSSVDSPFVNVVDEIAYQSIPVCDTSAA